MVTCTFTRLKQYLVPPDFREYSIESTRRCSKFQYKVLLLNSEILVHLKNIESHVIHEQFGFNQVCCFCEAFSINILKGSCYSMSCGGGHLEFIINRKIINFVEDHTRNIQTNFFSKCLVVQGRKRKCKN